MIRPIVLPDPSLENPKSKIQSCGNERDTETATSSLQPGATQRMDPLSEVLALMKPQLYVAGGFAVSGDVAIHFPKHRGIKCYAMLTGDCWLVVEGAPEPVQLRAGDCFLLPRGLPFRLATDLSLEPLLYTVAFARFGKTNEAPGAAGGTRYIAGGHFALTGGHAEMLLQSLPPIVHIRREPDKAAMRWSLERMREELRDPQPGGSLIAQQLAYTMLIQALRLHLMDAAHTRPGWLAALADKHMSIAIESMHSDPGYCWTLESLAGRVGMSRSVFALRFRETVGVTPMEYLTRWRMLLAADRLQNSSDGLSAIAQSLGYQSESAFGKAFRRVMGCSPRRYGRPAAVFAHPAKRGVAVDKKELVVTA
jgi:AraC-like DNA-binding protein